MRVAELIERIGKHDPLVTKHHGIFIVDNPGKLVGIITRGDLVRSLKKDQSGEISVLDAGSRHLVVTYPDAVLYDAAARMLRADLGRMPVVSREDPTVIVGYLGRSGVLAARLRRLEEEHVREPGWSTRQQLSQRTVLAKSTKETG